MKTETKTNVGSAGETKGIARNAILAGVTLCSLIGGMMAARMGDMTVHGGVIVGPCCPTVMIGIPGMGGALAAAAKRGRPFCEKCAAGV